MITCSDCSKKRLVWVTTDNGEEVLYELGAPHFVHCKTNKASENGQKPAKVAKSAKKAGPAPDPMAATVVEWLMGPAHGIKKPDAEAWVAAASPAEDADALYLAVLGKMNAEMLAKERR